ncbi:hypothetical protein E2P81_ATG05869 [Venturia nashicola]|nr:hypothetical protein E2P81_ATG05869 [Venturia nashicola]
MDTHKTNEDKSDDADDDSSVQSEVAREELEAEFTVTCEAIGGHTQELARRGRRRPLHGPFNSKKVPIMTHKRPNCIQRSLLEGGEREMPWPFGEMLWPFWEMLWPFCKMLWPFCEML